MGTSNAETLTGTTNAESFFAGDGNDILIGNGGADVMNGGKGDDIFQINASNITALLNVAGAAGNTMQLSKIDGGTGIDTLQLTTGAGNLELTQISNVGAVSPDGLSRFESIEIIDLSVDNLANVLTLELKDVLDLSGMNIFNTSNTVAVSGTSIGAIVGRHQMAIFGTMADTVDLDLANWTATDTVVTYRGHDLKVYWGTSSYAQLLIDT